MRKGHDCITDELQLRLNDGGVGVQMLFSGAVLCVVQVVGSVALAGILALEKVLPVFFGSINSLFIIFYWFLNSEDYFSNRWQKRQC